MRTSPPFTHQPSGPFHPAGPILTRRRGVNLAAVQAAPLRCERPPPAVSAIGPVTVRCVQEVVGGPGREGPGPEPSAPSTQTAALAQLGTGPVTGPAATHVEGQGRSWSRLRRPHKRRRRRTSAPTRSHRAARPAGRRRTIVGTEAELLQNIAVLLQYFAVAPMIMLLMLLFYPHPG